MVLPELGLVWLEFFQVAQHGFACGLAGWGYDGLGLLRVVLAKVGWVDCWIGLMSLNKSGPC